MVMADVVRVLCMVAILAAPALPQPCRNWLGAPVRKGVGSISLRDKKMKPDIVKSDGGFRSWLLLKDLL